MTILTQAECDAVLARLGKCDFDARDRSAGRFHFELESVRPREGESVDVILTWRRTGRGAPIKADRMMTRAELEAVDPKALAEEMRELAEIDLQHAPTLKELRSRR